MKATLTLLISFLMTISLFAQNDDNYLLKIDDTEIGGYIGLNTRYTNVDSKPAGFLDIKLAVVIDHNWAVGIIGSGLYYDRKLTKLVDDGTYHLNAAYGAIFVERIFNIGDGLRLSLGIATGSGTAFYKYDNEYEKEKVWTEEIIDLNTFAVFEPSIELQYQISDNWHLGIMTSYRNTSPLKLIGTDDNMLRNLAGGISVKWGIL